MELQPANIRSKIYEIRGHRVMLDFDLAEMYRVETKNLNLSVKRNIKRFPSDFMFQLTVGEWDALRLQNETSKRGGRRYLPYAFTEQGVAMLSGLLNSDIAIEMNIAIMRAFVYVRQIVLTPHASSRMAELEKQMRELKEYIEKAFADYNDINEDTRIQLDLINRALAELQVNKQATNNPRRRVGYIQPDD
ncbi:MAG: ORF6N domain-containing protein [Bacteroidales bacterium]|jgi:hypothetical protein|nr:ORF6N domain-containing protein [Bacteroidales bacterium]